MGLKPSLFMAVRFYYLAEEFARGNRRHKTNALHWDHVRMNLPGETTYDPTLPCVMKWDNLVDKIAGDIVAFVDNLRVFGPLGGASVGYISTSGIKVTIPWTTGCTLKEETLGTNPGRLSKSHFHNDGHRGVSIRGPSKMGEGKSPN
jgi:hypothetical protein